MNYNKNSKLYINMKNELIKLEDKIDSDIILYYGGFVDGIEKYLKNAIENIDSKRKKLSVILTTNGGSINPVIRIVNILRHHYDIEDFDKNVNFKEILNSYYDSFLEYMKLYNANIFIHYRNDIIIC